MKRRPFRGWLKLNDRRQDLIVKKHQGGGLDHDQEAEYQMLQKIAEAVMDYVSPSCTIDTNQMIRKMTEDKWNSRRTRAPKARRKKA